MASNNASIHEVHLASAFYWPFKLLFTVVLVFLGLGIATMVIDIIAMKYFWADSDGLAHMRQVLELSAHATTWFGNETLATRLANQVSELTYWVFFKATNLHQAVERFADPTPVNTVDTFYRNQIIAPFQQEIFVAMLGIQTYGVRLSILLSSLPLFIIGYGVGFFDGLVARFIRRASAGRESSSLYHRAKFAQLSALAFIAMLYLCVPINFDPRFIVLPTALLIGLLARLQWKYYKKYL